MAEISGLGLLILHVAAKRGTVARLDAEGPDKLLDEYEVGEEWQRDYFKAHYSDPVVREGVNLMWQGHDALVAAGVVEDVESWEPLIGA